MKENEVKDWWWEKKESMNESEGMMMANEGSYEWEWRYSDIMWRKISAVSEYGLCLSNEAGEGKSEEQVKENDSLHVKGKFISEHDIPLSFSSADIFYKRNGGQHFSFDGLQNLSQGA